MSFVIGGIVSSPPVQPLWLGFGLSGEFGAIAANDQWRSTVYNYQPLFRPTIPPLPQPTKGAALPTSNGVSPNAGDEYFAFTWDAAVDSAINNATYRVIFFAKSMNATGDFGDITVGGTEDTPRWFLRYDDDLESVPLVRPQHLAAGDQARVKRMSQDGVDWIYFVGLTYPAGGFGRQRNGCTNIFYYRCYAKDITIHCTGPGNAGTSEWIWWYECFLDGSMDGSGNDVHFLNIAAASNNLRVISCEARDLAGDFFDVDSSAVLKGCIVEDCDYYRTLFTDNDGIETSDPAGNYSRGEGFIDIKHGGRISETEKVLVLGCRVWGMRLVDSTLHPGAGSGTPLAVSVTTVDKEYIDFRQNVCHDIVSGGTRFVDGAHLGGGNHTIAQNIFADIRGAALGDTYPFWLPTDFTEHYSNTIADTDAADPTFIFFRTSGSVLSLDSKGNALIDTSTTTWPNQANLDANCEINYNAYIGSGYELELPAGSTNYVNATRANMNFGDFHYLRKKQSEPEVGTIPDIVPTSSTPSGFLTGVPGVGHADQLGNRAGIGVGNEIFGYW